MNELNNILKNSLVPVNETGRASDIEKKIELSSELKAKKLYGKAHHILLKPKDWEKVINIPGTIHFVHHKNPGSHHTHRLEVTDHIGLDITGDGPKNGDGFDWLKVDELLENYDEAYDETLVIRLQPSQNPGRPNTRGAQADHLFKSSASFTLILKRSGQQVVASFHGRNELPNLTGVKIRDKLRNAIGSFLFMAGYSRMIWSSFLKGLLYTQKGSY